MAPPFGLFVKAFAGETIERTVREAIEHHMKDAADRGDDGRSIALGGLKAVGNKNVMDVLRKLPGFTVPLVGTALGSFLETTDKIDKLLPNDNRPGVKEAKFILKQIAPHVIIGAGEGWTDAMERAVDKVRSNPAITPTGPAEADVVFVPHTHPQLAFVPIRDAAGQVLYMSDGSTPRCKGALYTQILANWNKDHGPKMMERTEGGGKGKPRTTKQVLQPGQPFTGEFLPLSEWIRSLPEDTTTMSAADIASIKELTEKKKAEPEKPKTWAEKLSQESLHVMFALSKTKSQLSWLDRVIGEDFFKDLPNKADITLMNALGDKFKAKIRDDGMFDHIDYIAILEFVDDWMGAELTIINKLRLALGRMRAQLHKGVSWKKALFIFLLAISPLWLFAILFVSLFVTGAYLLIAGMFADVTQKFLGYENGRIAAYAAVIVGSWTIIILLMLLAPAQAMITWVSAVIPGVDKNNQWLKDTGRKISALVAPYGAMAAILVLFGTPVIWRALLPIAALGAIGVAMIFASAGFHKRIRNEALKAGMWFKLLTIILPFVLLIVGALFDVLQLNFRDTINNILQMVQASKGLQSLIGFCVVGIVGFLIVRELEIVAWKKEDGMRTETTRQKSPLMRFIVLLIAVLVAIWPWIDTSKEKIKVADETQSSPTMIQPEEVETKSEQPKKQPTRLQKEKKASRQECEGLSYSMKRELGCK